MEKKDILAQVNVTIRALENEKTRLTEAIKKTTAMVDELRTHYLTGLTSLELMQKECGDVEASLKTLHKQMAVLSGRPLPVEAKPEPSAPAIAPPQSRPTADNVGERYPQCPNCKGSGESTKAGFRKRGVNKIQIYQCRVCNRKYADPSKKMMWVKPSERVKDNIRVGERSVPKRYVSAIENYMVDRIGQECGTKDLARVIQELGGLTEPSSQTILVVAIRALQEQYKGNHSQWRFEVRKEKGKVYYSIRKMEMPLAEALKHQEELEALKKREREQFIEANRKV